MKITTDKVYYNGSEFIVNSWPEVKTYVNCFSEEACNCAKISFEKGWVRDVVDGYDDNCPHRYKSALTRAIEEGYVVKDTQSIQFLFSMDKHPLMEGFHTLPESREFECSNVDYDGVPADRGVAILLPKKEEIKPAPLGESSEEQKLQNISGLLRSIDRDIATFVSPVAVGKLRSPFYLNYVFLNGESNLIEFQIRLSSSVLSPTSEPPEEQAELWKEARRLIDTWQIDELFKNFTIHRKRD